MKDGDDGHSRFKVDIRIAVRVLLLGGCSSSSSSGRIQMILKNVCKGCQSDVKFAAGYGGDSAETGMEAFWWCSCTIHMHIVHFVYGCSQ